MAGVEIQRFVDENSDDEILDVKAKQKKKKSDSLWDSTFARLGLGGEPDWDRTFAYKTYKIVRIKDAKLGLLYWGIVTLVVMYIIIVAFFIHGKHAKNAPGFGTVIVRFKGKAFAGQQQKVFDEIDLRFPTIEPTGAFIVTSRVVMPNQKHGVCVDWDSPRKCDTDNPCPEGEDCTGGFCACHGWCPSLGEKNVANVPEGSFVEHMEGLEHTLLQIMTSITFPGISDKIYVAGKSKYGMERDFENITLGELAALAEPQVKFRDLLMKGGLIGVSFSWSCEVTGECEPMVVIKHLDGGKGFAQKRARHHRKDGVRLRDAIYMTGIRILVDSQGVGRKSSLVLIVIQIGSGLALLRVAAMAADTMMLYLYDKTRTEAYYKCKVIETDDRTDLQDRIHLVKLANQPYPHAQILGQTRTVKNAGSGTAAHAPLGLGAGARGGHASTNLRGRASAG